MWIILALGRVFMYLIDRNNIRMLVCKQMHICADIQCLLCDIFLSICRAGLIFGSAGIFVALMPWMDRRREERIKQAQLAKTTESSEEQKTITPPELRLTEKIEDLKIKATIA